MTSIFLTPNQQHEIADFTRLFTEIYQAIDSKQLRPFVRTQYMRTAFQVSDICTPF